MHILVLRSTAGLNADGWGIEIGHEKTISYFFGLFKRQVITWTLWRKYSTRTKMLQVLDEYKHSSKYMYRPVQIKYK